jgi:hypothetical protein
MDVQTRGIQQDYVEQQSPPSSYAVAAALDGESGAWGRVLLVTFARAFVIAPGLYLGGVRGRYLLTGSAMASITITGMLFGLYALKRGTTPTAQTGAVRRTLNGLSGL